MGTMQTESTPEEHKLVITDVRFRPNSSQLATSSVDKSVRLWDAANVIFFAHIFFFEISVFNIYLKCKPHSNDLCSSKYFDNAGPYILLLMYLHYVITTL